MTPNNSNGSRDSHGGARQRRHLARDAPSAVATAAAATATAVATAAAVSDEQQQQQPSSVCSASRNSPSVDIATTLPLRQPCDEKAAKIRQQTKRRRQSRTAWLLPFLGATMAVVILMVDMKIIEMQRQEKQQQHEEEEVPPAPRVDDRESAETAEERMNFRGQGSAPGRLEFEKWDRGNQKPSAADDGATKERGTDTASTDNHVGQTVAISSGVVTTVTAADGITVSNQRMSTFPAVVLLGSVGFLDGHKALRIGQKDQLHTDSYGDPLSWWVPARRNHDNYDDGSMLLTPTFLDEEHFEIGRQIRSDTEEEIEQFTVPEPTEQEKQWENYDQYEELMDDDAVLSKVFTQQNSYRQCKPPDWYRLQFPTCNVFHEMKLVHSNADSKYLGKGFFRMSFSIKETGQPWHILKVMRWRREKNNLFKRHLYEKTRMDALVMERLTSSPRITDMYGFCATSIMTEPLPGEVWEEAVQTGRVIERGALNDEDDVDPQNNYAPTQKIKMALEMAEALADLHGFKDGMIVHDDIDLGQYLRNEEGKMKLNDFNRAKVQMYDNIRGEYCKYYNGHIGGKFRAPEEFIPDILNEKIDIFSLGNNFYGLLTGLWPHYYDDNEKAQKKYIKGKMPYIDKRYRTRSYAEGRLVEAIKMCHKREPDDRADIFTIVDFLRMSVDENRKQLNES